MLGVLPRTPREVSRRDEVQLEQPSVSRGGQGVRIYPYGVNRNKIEQFVRGLAMVTYDLDDADVVLTIKNYYRRKPQALRDAESAAS